MHEKQRAASLYYIVYIFMSVCLSVYYTAVPIGILLHRYLLEALDEVRHLVNILLVQGDVLVP